MNISQPVASSVGSVEFSFLSEKEVKAISVRKIENESTFDTLLNPVPGGLYDPALGSWGDAPCATCNLGQALCPGHPGHIELPVPIYHPVFMDQTLRLLRASCAYCHRFRLRPVDINKYICKLRLLQYGLLREAGYVDAIGEDFSGMALPDVPHAEHLSSDDEEDENASNTGIIRSRLAYVRRVLKGHKISLGDIRNGKHEGAGEMRRDIIKEFMKEVALGRKCAHCSGITPTYRKDRYVKIFEKPLSGKEQAKMTATELKRRDAVTLIHKAKPAENGYHSDEGVGDMGSSSDELAESVNGSDSGSDAEDLDEVGNLIPRSADKISKAAKAEDDGPRQRYISSTEVLERLRLLFENEQEVLRLVYHSKPLQAKDAKVTPDMFFLRALLVPPNRFRPEARTGDAQIEGAQQNSLYKQIISAASRVRDIHSELAGADYKLDLSKRPPRTINALHEAWTSLQDCVNSLIDKDRNPVQGQAAKRNEEGIKQKLEKKEGLFRKNMMGKRVNYAARSVISPDPNIETNEIGVPPVFATKLTYPEPVTSHNFRDMQQAVINGTDKWPGASAIENENGQIINLRAKSLEERMSLANQLLAPTNNTFSTMRNKKVHRHLTNGDVVLMNRQPTLHKPSIMGHRARVLPGEKTIRMHYANCNTYNADFDGDEMNMHFPQNEIARAEALQLADTDHQYISGTQGKPLRGLIQDHLSVSVALCGKDTFLDKSAYQQLVYNALRPESGHIHGERIEMVAPAIVKPVARWTGKQVISTILKNIRPPGSGDLWMEGKSQVPGARWGAHTEEGKVTIQDGELLTGILDKAQLGPTSGGLIHAVHEIYGPAIAGKLLSGLGRLLTKYLNMRAFTCGMDDLLLTPEGEATRKATLAPAASIGLEVAARYVTLSDRNPTSTDPELLERLEGVLRDDTKQEGLDLLMNKQNSELSSKVTSACFPNGLAKQFPKNQMQSMTVSGAKGGLVNANQISCNLGQQVLEGRRVPIMISGKSLPCFAPFDTDVRAGGYIVNRFLTGIRPQEYYFHHMAGREGLIDTAVKTSRSGYLQRCLIKGMEGLKVTYDSSVRDADGSLVQFLYGEDGQDVTKQKYLTDFGFLLRNIDSQLAHLDLADPTTNALFDHRDLFVKRSRAMLKKVKSNMVCLDEPVNALVDPARHAFATSEKFYEAMAKYVKDNADGLLKEKTDRKEMVPAKTRVGRKAAEKVFVAKYLRSLVEPGEAVGIVAGQSVGEPSTQMTLNTFHLAGHSAKNVTLGIPRLREILMTASASISTPAMTLFLRPDLGDEESERFAKSIAALPLAHVLDKVMVRERTGKGSAYPLARLYDVRLEFFPSPEYTVAYGIEIADVLDAVEKKLAPILRRLTAKELKQAKSKAAVPDIGEKVGVVETARGPGGAQEAGTGNDDDDDDVDNGDGDATSAKQKANRSEEVSYGPDDEDDEAVQRSMDRQEELEDEGFVGSPPPSPKGAAAAGEAEDDMMDDDKDASGKSRAARVMANNPDISHFHCDEDGGQLCRFTLEFDINSHKMLMLSLVQEAIRRTLVRQIPGIGSSTYVPDEKLPNPLTGNDEPTAVVHTQGVNLRAMQAMADQVDPNRISTNDIVSMLNLYGVEACRGNIIRELGAVFSSHGIGVDNRHLNLIADYMTRNGGFTPFNRMGLKGNVSPFTKMSFETTLAFLKDAVLDGDWDDLKTPSSRLVMGRLGKTGTGAFEVLSRVPMASSTHS